MGEEKCAVCMKAASQRCGGCQVIYYCSRDHQKRDWKKHKTQCRPFMVCNNEMLGRHLVASRDIKSGEVVLSEKPLIRGPSQVTGPVCLSCLQFITPETSRECSHCGWPMCGSEQCHLSNEHKPECNWAIEKRNKKVRISQFHSPHPSYEFVTPLRICYQRDNNKKLWNELMALESHCEARRNTAKQLSDTKSVVQLLQKFYNLESEFSTELILKICGIIEVNGHEIPTTEPPHVVVYSTVSMLEHSCTPNCSKSFTEEGHVIIHAADSIKKGEHLSICYTDALWGTGNRRHHLKETKYFSCRCKRCLDPTELKTFFSAVTCRSDNCGGSVLPPSFCDGGAVPWACQTCGLKMEWKDINDLLDKIGWELDQFPKEDIKECQNFLNKWNSSLHRNHFYMTEVALSLAQQYGQVDGLSKLTDDELAHKMRLCKSLVDLLNVIAPGECRIRGVLYFEIHSSIAEFARRISHAEPSAVGTLLKESRDFLMKTITCLQHEPEIMPEGKLKLDAEKTLIQLDKTLQAIEKPISPL